MVIQNKYNFISGDAYKDIKGNSSLLPQEVVFNVSQMKIGESRLIETDDGIYHLTVNNITLPNATYVSEVKEEYTEFANTQSRSGIIDLLNDQLYTNARINVNIGAPINVKRIYQFFLIFILTACSQTEAPVDTGLITKTFHWGNGTEPQGIDPHIVTGVPEHHVLQSLCEGLTSSNPKGGESLPGAASSWTISEDGKIYTFYLQENGKWSNGDPVTADDFVWSWKRILTASLGSQYPDMLYYVKNASEYHNQEIDDFNLVGVKAIDELTLKLN